MSLISKLEKVGLQLRLGADGKLIIKGLDRMEPGTARNRPGLCQAAQG
jgi:hypothetical protein